MKQYAPYLGAILAVFVFVLFSAGSGVKCVARTGSPAQGSYGVALTYLSPAWVMSNSRNIVDPAPMGTGEHDVAVLVITDSRHTFPYVTLGNNFPQHEEPVAIVSYAAQYLDANELASALYPTIVLSHVKEILTFSEANTPDVLGFSGSVAAQEGASGGGVVDARGVLVGTVTTSSVTGPTQERFITAITAQYVRSEYALQTERELSSILSMSPAASVATFSSKADNLKPILENVLDGK